MHRIPLPQEKIDAFCKRHPVRKLSLFSSALTDKFNPESDIVILIEFEPDAKIGFFKLIEMELELSELMGRKVDLRTPQDLSHFFRDTVMQKALPLYGRA